ncbi:glycosyltransferase family 2 protein [Dokdonella sp.]|uniref:glycosyltransferase family 2 protein n=1 Tax=Dokdonella sp. TaxID=2291710 RepID=UPI003C47A2CB
MVSDAISCAPHAVFDVKPGELQPGLTSVVVVTADSGELAVNCVASVLASTAPIELLVVDNASTDGLIAELEKRFGGDSRLRIVEQAANIGFGPACNRGAALARGDGLLFLNPDCLVQDATIGRMREVAAGLVNAGVLGVRVLDRNGGVEKATRRRDPSLSRALCSLLGLARFESRWPAMGGISMPPASIRQEAEFVDAVSGACLFLPRAVFNAVDGFDESYFLHCEDLDLCRRVRDAGFDVMYVSDITVRHEQGGSSRRRPLFVSRHKHRGMWRYFRRFDPAFGNLLLRAVVWSGIWLHFLLYAPIHGWRQIRAGKA